MQMTSDAGHAGCCAVPVRIVQWLSAFCERRQERGAGKNGGGGYVKQRDTCQTTNKRGVNKPTTMRVWTVPERFRHFAIPSTISDVRYHPGMSSAPPPSSSPSPTPAPPPPAGAAGSGVRGAAAPEGRHAFRRT